VEWSPDFVNVPGIYDNSSSPCAGNADGACDTAQIDAQYSASSPSSYAAGACLATIDGYSDWYLPAICEMAYTTTNNAGCGSAGSPLTQNMLSNIGVTALSGMSSGLYWTSTEFSGNPTLGAWVQFLSTGGGSEQVPFVKSELGPVRCARILTN
jgi:hypothetical protein